MTKDLTRSCKPPTPEHELILQLANRIIDDEGGALVDIRTRVPGTPGC